MAPSSTISVSLIPLDVGEKDVYASIRSETIAAIATPPGQGGIGIVRVSGPLVGTIAQALLGRLPPPRQAQFSSFRDQSGEAIDEGLALFFAQPRSFTGEDVLELQGHGGPVVMDLLLKRVLTLGARLARPGEFSERAFLNDKLDLVQAEAISDLIESGSEAAARMAVRSLEGEFSRRIQRLVDQVVQLRTTVEAAIDFPEEEVDFLSTSKVSADLQEITWQLQQVQESARVGRLLRDGMTVVIAGRPNAGKSSLMNALAGRDTAIVTEVAGTTRDLLQERIQIDGMPLHLIDTAGLCDSTDPIEQEGVRRARQALARADRILWILDDTSERPDPGLIDEHIPQGIPLTWVCNKIDLSGTVPGEAPATRTGPIIGVSAKTGAGLAALRAHLKECMGYRGVDSGEFLARRRHLVSLDKAMAALTAGERALTETKAGELLAEDLRQVQYALSEITGEFSADDLLGEIFSSFCIGK